MGLFIRVCTGLKEPQSNLKHTEPEVLGKNYNSSAFKGTERGILLLKLDQNYNLERVAIKQEMNLSTELKATARMGGRDYITHPFFSPLFICKDFLLLAEPKVSKRAQRLESIREQHPKTSQARGSEENRHGGAENYQHISDPMT